MPYLKVRFNQSELDDLQSLATVEGMSERDLVRKWVLEHLSPDTAELEDMLRDLKATDLGASDAARL